ncbi:hypothetical protein [Nostoc sp. MS1]|uniref:hypothetical protein n=1 Tax=Nostoc sp. MS1 TaxID=2764711 RepID=UPI001CC57265|nr:hypothetical protein [Nostoc sp. MS1]BCL36949.1 hypothetical protein NSMS1_33960 [Nostoc sp. MS1]
MKNKFLALAALGTAALGSAVVSAPANAQIAQGAGPSQTINVNVSVPEILYLRTVQNADVVITPTQLAGNAVTLTSAGGTPPAYIGSDQSTGATVDTTSPFSAPGAPVAVSIPNAYIVWSNSPTGSYSVAFDTGTFTASGSGGATITVEPTNATLTNTAEGLVTATPKNIDLNVTLDANTKAGSYAGTVTVEAFRPN